MVGCLTMRQHYTPPPRRTPVRDAMLAIAIGVTIAALLAHYL